MELNEIIASMEAILFAAGDVVPAARIAQVLGVETQAVLDAAAVLAQSLLEQGRGIRLLRLEDNLQLCSAPEYSQAVIRALEQRRPPRLSSAALEVLAIVAYFQPVTRAYIDQIRGVDSSYTVGVLIERGLIEPAGKLEVPGRPTLYKTGSVFLRTMDIQSLDELPTLPNMDTDEGIIALQNKIEALQAGELEGQISFSEAE
ncbi:MAG: SMC-Scp complex subunit ScpB [Ruminococcaceae bacterium]|jgi:segregation and condensation protein B|nr:SMC-Scp complex subunit ScpB [Oscillospiraceae bacterium]